MEVAQVLKAHGSQASFPLFSKSASSEQEISERARVSPEFRPVASGLVVWKGSDDNVVFDIRRFGINAALTARNSEGRGVAEQVVEGAEH
jgi:hypothetical protein